jgi:hypothetical protein
LRIVCMSSPRGVNGWVSTVGVSTVSGNALLRALIMANG